MTSEMITIAMPDGAAEAYVSRPDEGEHPAVLLLQDAIGVRPRLKEMADRIAGWGYVVMVPNLFYRDGTAEELAPKEDLRLPGKRDEFFATAITRVRAYTPDKSGPDVDVLIDTLLDLPGVAGREIGVTGYCLGARVGLRAAAAHPQEVVALGMFHAGGLVTDEPDSPHRILDGMRAEVVARHGDGDASNPPEAIAVVDAALATAGVTFSSEIYEGAPHGYAMSDTSLYVEEAAERHFAELEALLARTFGRSA